MFLIWAAFGALIGVAAAQRKGFSMIAGVIGGLLLGPLAFLMFFASGGTQRQCPHCAEFVKPEATVCKHCHRELSKLSPPELKAYAPGISWAFIVCGSLAAILVIVLVVLRISR